MAANENVSEYLQEPRRKRKRYIVMALSERFDGDLRRAMEQFIKTSFPGLAIGSPESPEELKRYLVRQIVLLVLDDELADRAELMQMVRVLKTSKFSGGAPVLFLTRSPDELIRVYNQHLAEFQENDEYMKYVGVAHAQILSRIKLCADTTGHRRGRRYKVDLPVTYYHLTHDKKFQGIIEDISIHGVCLRAQDRQMFRAGDQLVLSIPVGNIVKPGEGEFLHVPGKVRRVFISGDYAGVSFEHTSDRHLELITRLVTYSASDPKNLARAAEAGRSKSA